MPPIESERSTVGRGLLLQLVSNTSPKQLLRYYFQPKYPRRPRHAFFGDSRWSICRRGILLSEEYQPDGVQLVPAPRRTCTHCLYALRALQRELAERSVSERNPRRRRKS